MTNHVSSVHEKKKPFKCGYFEYSCSLISNMYTHDASVHEKKKPFHCSICDKSFFNKQKMKSHVGSVHEKKNHSNVTFVTTDVLEKIV